MVRQTQGMSEHGHESVGMLHYVRFAVRIGFMGSVRLVLQFVLAIAELFRLRRAHWSEAATLLEAEHEKRVAKLADVTRDGQARLRALLSLQVPPITSTVRGILKSLLLDRIGLLGVCAVVIAVLLGVALHFGNAPVAVAGGVAIAAAWALADRWLTSQRHVDPTQLMVDRAAQLARIFPAAFVVMGHTHTPASLPAGDATYVNLGAWAEEEPEPASANAFLYRAPRTHLVIHVGEAGAEAQFYSWEATGPKPWDAPA